MMVGKVKLYLLYWLWIKDIIMTITVLSRYNDPTGVSDQMMHKTETGGLPRLVRQHVLLHLPHHQQPGQHLLHAEPVKELCRVPDWRVRHTATLRLQVEHVVTVLGRLGTLGEVELVQLDGAPQGVVVVLVLLVHLPLLSLLSLCWRRIVPQEDCPLLLAWLVSQGGLLPVLHDVGEGQLEMLINSF